MKTTWHKGIITWREQDCLCVSVPFTWLLPQARAFALSHPTDRVVAGGPAVRLMPDYVREWAEIETIEPLTPPLRRANQQASRTTFGCPNRCKFCGVRIIEGEYRELADFEAAPILCDSNFLACSDAHFNRVVDRLKQANYEQVDFNQGLDASLLTQWRANRLAELPLRPRFAWDTAADEIIVMGAVERMEIAGVRCRSSDITNTASAPAHIYVLVGWRETPDEAMYRMEALRSAKLCGVAMRYQPLNALKRNAYCPTQWSERELRDFCRYWNRLRWFNGFTFEQYREGVPREGQARLFA